ncbi:MAG TPA: hypothetical protein VF156_13355, partial [Agromyces sp.]
SVRLRVADDGTGIEPGAPRGVGLRSMRERAFELGGTLHLATGADGTLLTATLPRHAATPPAAPEPVPVPEPEQEPLATAAAGDRGPDRVGTEQR